MADAYLPGAMIELRRLVLLGREEGVPEEERTAAAADLVGHLWATVQKGRNYLDNKLSADEDQAEADAVMEEVLGHVWQLTDLKEKGYARQALNLLELAYERRDDPAPQSAWRRATCSTCPTARSTRPSPTGRSRGWRRSPSSRAGCSRSPSPRPRSIPASSTAASAGRRGPRWCSRSTRRTGT